MTQTAPADNAILSQKATSIRNKYVDGLVQRYNATHVKTDASFDAFLVQNNVMRYACVCVVNMTGTEDDAVNAMTQQIDNFHLTVDTTQPFAYTAEVTTLLTGQLAVIMLMAH